MKLQKIGASIARILLGFTFILSGFVKAVDPLGTTYKIEDYLDAIEERRDTRPRPTKYCQRNADGKEEKRYKTSP